MHFPSGLPLQRVQRGAVVFLALLGAAGGAASGEKPPRFDERRLLAHVMFLAAEELQGRKAGSAEEMVAGRYLESQLEARGVAAPVKPGRFQPFRLSGGRAPLSGSQADGRPTPMSRNVLGWIEGTDPALKDEVVILGAHFDHLGKTEDGMCLGAEDNASGTAVLLEVAAALGTSRPGRSILVIFFGAEEAGLLGSSHFVNHPPFALERVAVMVNIDMIGRPLLDQRALAPLRSLVGMDPRRSVGVVGVKGRPGLAALVDAACRETDLQVFGTRNIPLLSDIVEKMAKDRGDHAPFETMGIPIVFFGSGESDDYHKPSDTVAKIDALIMARRAAAIHATAVALSRVPREKLALRAAPATPAPAGAALK